MRCLAKVTASKVIFLIEGRGRPVCLPVILGYPGEPWVRPYKFRIAINYFDVCSKPSMFKTVFL